MQSLTNNKTGSSRNGAIDFLRFVFACVILVYHFHPIKTTIPGGYIAVEFFLLVSGYLAAGKADRTNIRSWGEVYRFLKHKLFSFYPAFLIAWVFSFIIKQVCAPNGFSLTECFWELMRSPWSVLMIRQAGVAMGEYFEWYLSAMMLSLILIYPLLLKWRKGFTLMIAPFIFMGYCGYAVQGVGNIAMTEEWTGLFFGGFYRGLATISLGCICYAAAAKLRKIPFNRRGQALLSILEAVGYLLVFGLIANTGRTTLDFTIVLILACCVTVTFSGKSLFPRLFKHRIFGWLGTLSLELYLNHAVVASILLLRFGNELEGIMSWQYLFVVYIAASFVLTLAAHGLLKLLRKIFPAGRMMGWVLDK